MLITEVKEPKTDSSMSDLREDTCPRCGGKWQVGDYVCWGFCYSCYCEEEIPT